MDSSIRRLIGTDANRAHLRALPSFRLDTSLPKDLRALLDRLDRAEEQQRERPH